MGSGSSPSLLSHRSVFSYLEPRAFRHWFAVGVWRADLCSSYVWPIGEKLYEVWFDLIDHGSLDEGAQFVVRHGFLSHSSRLPSTSPRERKLFRAQQEDRSRLA